jgi:predicted SPOUT superfamily RNA methylase MTH1
MEDSYNIQERIDQSYQFRIKVFFATQIIQYAATPLNLRRPEFKDQTKGKQ